jgi:pyruvate/2-oxoglutarate/acetoin dehydrogenase E1 component
VSELRFGQAINRALADAMAEDSSVILLGEDIAGPGGPFGVTRGLLDRFGPERVRNTPISEAAIVGASVGAAMTGLRPVVEIMFMDFVTLAMDQIANHAAKFHYMYGPQACVPLVIRTPAGGGRSYGATHSQSLEAWFLHVPGLKVITPATPADAKGLLKSAIRDDNPVLCVEHKLLYATTGPVPDGDVTVPLGQAAIRREGRDVTLVAYSYYVGVALQAAEALARDGIEAEVVDLRTLVPLDTAAVLDSVRKTGRLVCIEEGTRTGGVGAEIAARVAEEAYEYLDAPIRRVATPDIPIPFSPVLEDAALPKVDGIVHTVLELLQR